MTGKEDVRITKAYADKTVITFDGGGKEGVIPAGKEIVSDAITMEVKAGENLQVSLYFKDYVELTAGTFISGPCSGGQYAYGDYAEEEILPADFTRNTNWYYFLSTIDVHTREENRAVVCYGDSITAGSWPDYLIFLTGCSFRRIWAMRSLTVVSLYLQQQIFPISPLRMQ